jgi:HEAT repeat protein
MNSELLDKAIEALKKYQWGVDPRILQPLRDAIVATQGDAAARKELESRLVAALSSDVPQAAKGEVCRMLRTIGSAASVPALAALLPDPKLSHMGRYALERIPAAEAAKAMLAALPKVGNPLKIGLIGSLGVRREVAAVAPLQGLLTDSDAAVARSATQALGVIGSPDAAKALATAKPGPVTADATLACAKNLLADGKTAEAKAAYERLLAGKPSDQVAAAAKRGLDACGGQ